MKVKTIHLVGWIINSNYIIYIIPSSIYVSSYSNYRTVKMFKFEAPSDHILSALKQDISNRKNKGHDILDTVTIVCNDGLITTNKNLLCTHSSVLREILGQQSADTGNIIVQEYSRKAVEAVIGVLEMEWGDTVVFDREVKELLKALGIKLGEVESVTQHIRKNITEELIIVTRKNKEKIVTENPGNIQDTLIPEKKQEKVIDQKVKNKVREKWETKKDHHSERPKVLKANYGKKKEDDAFDHIAHKEQKLQNTPLPQMHLRTICPKCPRKAEGIKFWSSKNNLEYHIVLTHLTDEFHAEFQANFGSSSECKVCGKAVLNHGNRKHHYVQHVPQLIEKAKGIILDAKNPSNEHEKETVKKSELAQELNQDSFKEIEEEDNWNTETTDNLKVKGDEIKAKGIERSEQKIIKLSCSKCLKQYSGQNISVVKKYTRRHIILEHYSEELNLKVLEYFGKSRKCTICKKIFKHRDKRRHTIKHIPELVKKAEENINGEGEKESSKKIDEQMNLYLSQAERYPKATDNQNTDRGNIELVDKGNSMEEENEKDTIVSSKYMKCMYCETIWKPEDWKTNPKQLIRNHILVNHFQDRISENNPRYYKKNNCIVCDRTIKFPNEKVKHLFGKHNVMRDEVENCVNTILNKNIDAEQVHDKHNDSSRTFEDVEELLQSDDEGQNLKKEDEVHQVVSAIEKQNTSAEKLLQSDNEEDNTKGKDQNNKSQIEDISNIDIQTRLLLDQDLSDDEDEEEDKTFADADNGEGKENIFKKTDESVDMSDNVTLDVSAKDDKFNDEDDTSAIQKMLLGDVSDDEDDEISDEEDSKEPLEKEINEADKDAKYKELVCGETEKDLDNCKDPSDIDIEESPAVKLIQSDREENAKGVNQSNKNEIEGEPYYDIQTRLLLDQDLSDDEEEEEDDTVANNKEGKESALKKINDSDNRSNKISLDINAKEKFDYEANTSVIQPMLLGEASDDVISDKKDTKVPFDRDIYDAHTDAIDKDQVCGETERDIQKQLLLDQDWSEDEEDEDDDIFSPENEITKEIETLKDSSGFELFAGEMRLTDLINRIDADLLDC